MEIKEIIAALESQIPNPREGLPEEVFLLVSSMTPLVNVDLLIKDARNQTLLSWRRDDFGPEGWHVPGGIIRFKETTGQRVRAVARNELGAEVEFDPVPLAVNEIIVPTRNKRGHFFSLLYECRLISEPDKRLECDLTSPVPKKWAWHDVCPHDLIPTHRKLYQRFIEEP